jgi:hypothetical protein
MAIHKRGPEGPETQTFHEDFKDGQEPLPEDPLSVEYDLPSLDLYVPDSEGILSPGWRGIRADFDDEGQPVTIVEKDGQQMTVNTAHLDEIQLEVYRAKNAPKKALSSRALELVGLDRPGETKHVTVIDPEGEKPPQVINIRHTE